LVPGHYATAGLTVLGLEAIRIDRELRQRFHRRRVQRSFGGVGRTIRSDGVAVERRVPCCRLSATERHALAAAARFRCYSNKVERAAHLAADHKRKFIHQFVLHLGGDLGVVALDQHCGGRNLDCFCDLA
jgi:hypothetical protein